jgi:hypothetical protein
MSHILKNSDKILYKPRDREFLSFSGERKLRGFIKSLTKNTICNQFVDKIMDKANVESVVHFYLQLQISLKN